jgi:formate dehydrogenase (NADP+) alpha subunit
MKKVTLTINGQHITADKIDTILQAALKNDIYIPNLCYHPDLEPAAVCRLCLVEIEGRRGQVVSCREPVAEGLIVETNTEEIDKVRRVTVELLIANHLAGCLTCPSDNICQLQQVASYMGIDIERLRRLKRGVMDMPVDTSNPFFVRDPNRCVLCGICVRTCEEIVGVSAIDFANRGFDTIINTFGDKPMLESRCVSCGECVARCPVGALTPKKYAKPDREVLSTCAYCGVGCQIYFGERSGKVISARGATESPVNHGVLCVKGRFGHEFINHPDRLTTPLIKKNGEFVQASWDEALDLIAEKFSNYKGGRFAVLSSAKCTNEENYIVQKFTRAVMGTNTVDHCARLCHAPTVAGLGQSFGSGAMTNSIGETADAKCILAIGTNTTTAHPIIANQMKQAVRNGAKMIVANPREIDLCEFADIFIQHQPGSDVALMMEMARIIIEENLHDREFIDSRCDNFDALKQSLAEFTPEFVEETTGVKWEKIAGAARVYATVKPGMLFYSMGITQHTHGTDNVLATSNLAMLTGNVGKRSTGVNPLRGQNNVQGACDMAALPNVYPGYQKVNLPEIQQKFEQAWGVELSPEPGLTHTEIFDAICNGEIKALYTVGENPIISEANSKHVAEALEKIDFFVAQDIFLTETAQFADVVLPAASFAEKNGTFTNTERRVQRVRKIIEPIGDSRPDWSITCALAKKLGAKGFDFENQDQIMQEIASLTPIYQGITYERIDDVGLQWPCRSLEDPGTVWLHSEKFATKDGKGQFKPLSYRPPFETPDDDYPLTLTTERSLYHFHTGTMTRKGGLDDIRGEEWVEMNPVDAEKLGIEDGQRVKVTSRRGKVEAKAVVTEVSPPGVVSMTFHFAESPTNVLTSPAIDPVAKIPETKVCAIKVEKISK